jgi:hypothetical protein
MLMKTAKPGMTLARIGPPGREARSASGRRADVQGLPRLSGLDLRLGQRGRGARHSRATALKDGDLLSIDIGTTFERYVSDRP